MTGGDALSPHDPTPTPLPIPGDARDLVLFGGSFDPPTRAHVELADRARRAAMPEGWLIYIPAARSPHKDDAPRASDAHRLEMVRLAIRDLPRAAVWTDEIDRATAGRPSYSVLTAERAHGLRPDARLRLLIGADQAQAFHRWKDERRLIELAPPIVMLRRPSEKPGELIDRLRETGQWSGPELDRWKGWIAEVATMGISATEARDLVGRVDAKDPRLAELLDPRVLGYIVEHGLYAG